MTPSISDGDFLIYKPFFINKDILLENLLILVENPLDRDSLIVKRISKINENSVEIIGDNKSISIDSRQFGKVNKNQIKGIVEKIIPIQ